MTSPRLFVCAAWVGSIVAGIGGLIPSPARAEASPIPPPAHIDAQEARIQIAAHDKINAAIDKACEYLLKIQENGNWDKYHAKTDAPTCSPTTLTMLAWETAGNNPHDPKIQQALVILDGQEPTDTMTAGARAQIFSAEWFRRGRKQKGLDDIIDAALTPLVTSRGLFGVKLDSKDSDVVSTYFALVGMDARLRSADKIQVPPTFWIAARQNLVRKQAADGSFVLPAPAANAAQLTADFRSTTAGFLALAIADDRLALSQRFDKCTGNVNDPQLDAAMAWLDAHASQAVQDIVSGKIQNPCEMALWIDRVGAMSGRQRFGGRPWVPELVAWLLRSQKPDGSWPGDLSETDHALMFLSHVHHRTALNKLIYPPGSKNAAWNERPRDVAHLGTWLGNALCCDYMDWNLVGIDDPLGDICTAPILYISGNQQIDFTAAQLAKLREYVETGGLILGNADCASPAFVDAFQKLGHQLFPHYAFRPLPQDHVIFDEMYHAAKWRKHPKISGLSNGVRELMVLIPEADLARDWQLNMQAKYNEASLGFALNLYVYATGKGWNAMGAPQLVAIDPKIEPKSTLRIACLEIGDNWNPEPAAWRQFSPIAHNDFRIDLQTTAVKLGSHQLAPFPFAHLTGTSKFSLTETQRAEIREYVEKGGTLLIDAAGGSVEFADSAEAELKTIFGDRAAAQLAAPLPPAHPLFNWTNNEAERIQFRSFSRRQLGNQPHSPRLRAIELENHRVGVFFSREDLTAGLAGLQSDGIVGYEPRTARRIVAELLRYTDRSRPH